MVVPEPNRLVGRLLEIGVEAGLAGIELRLDEEFDEGFGADLELLEFANELLAEFPDGLPNGRADCEFVDGGGIGREENPEFGD